MRPVIAMQTDFGVGGGSAMRGTCLKVDPELEVYEITHTIDKFNVRAAGRSLHNIVPYWPEGTVFVSVVDPGVGTSRRSCVARLSNGSYIVTPDNGTLTYVKERFGITAVRMIDESVNRLKGSEDVHIFHGRDVYAYCGARLAAGIIDFEGVGPEYPVDEIVEADYIRPGKKDREVSGMINEAGEHFGLIGTNIPFSWLAESGMNYGDTVRVTVLEDDRPVLDREMPLVRTFGDVPVGSPLVFSSEMRTVMMAVNQGNATREFCIGFGPKWKMTVRKEN